MSAYQQWTRGYAKQVIRRELMDAQGRWWSDAELEMYINDWQNDLQQELELVWGSATITTAINTLTLGTISPSMLRLEAVYYGTGTSSGYRLSGRLMQDLEVMNPEWRSATPNTPREVIQYDSTQMVVWPPLSQAGTFIFEYPIQLSFLNDNSLVSLPNWSQWSIKPYVCHRCYLRPGPTNDPKRALRYQAMYLREKARVRLLWDNFLPERWRKLKHAGHYEWDILKPPPAWDTGSNGGPFSLTQYQTFIPSGIINGLNPSFSVPGVSLALKLYRNGLLQTATIDYTWAISGNITLINFFPASLPQTGDELVVWTFSTGF